ncbi:MAG: bifunctional hydroxymethylpyrimidine kinase/phosphomethylpyrimidine kinase [Asgard group archaeon]
MGSYNSVLTVAGLDPTGGAGIAADLKVFNFFKLHGLVAITAVTVQNTKGVSSVEEIPGKTVKKQIQAIMEDFNVCAAKVGMLFSKGMTEVVANIFKKNNVPLIVDPVMGATRGGVLKEKEAVEALKEELLPVTLIVTPNIFEAEILSKIKIKDQKDAEEAARKIRDYGCENVMIKGGHVPGEKVVDTLLFQGKIYHYSREKIEVKKTHGTGCFFSAALTALIAKKEPLIKAVEKAGNFTKEAIKKGFNVGETRFLVT